MNEQRATAHGAAPTPPPFGPHPGLLIGVSLALLIASLAGTAIVTGGDVIPSPFGTSSDVAAFYSANGGVVRLAALLQLGSAIPLGIGTATFHARQQRLGIRVPGPTIGLFGGIAAAVLLAVSACITWTLGQPDVTAQPGIAHTLAYLSFGSGGFAHVLGLGLLVAGVAVPALLLSLMPRAFCLLGLVVAVIAELSFLSMVATPLQYLIPIGRFGSLVWLVAAGFLLPRTRHTQQADPS